MPRLLRLAFLLCLAAPAFAQPSLTLDLLGTYATGLFDDGAAEIVDYDPASQRLFFVNAADAEIVALDVSDPANPTEAFTIDASAFGGGANSVAVKNGIVALAVEADPAQDPGQVVFFGTDGAFRGTVPVGALPDGLAFSASGRYLVVANEGEPNDDYTVDPEGSVSVIDLQNGVAGATVANATFEDFNEGGPRFSEIQAAGVRIFGPGASVAEDLEPEFVTVEGDETAFVTLQENNGLAEIDLATATVTFIYGFGTKDHSLTENALDASNRDDGINIQPWPVVGMYQPDAVASYQVGGQTYLVTANEGDARDYDGFSEEARVGDLTLDPTAFPDAAVLQRDENLGRLKTTTTEGDLDGDGDYDRIFAYGARSFSIFQRGNALRLLRVFDSGDDFEQITAAALPANFNADNDDNDSFDSRSDDKGPEPEGVAVGEIDGRTYAFVGLERVGGVMTYDVTDPAAPRFIDYTNNRNFSVDAESPLAGDLGPEGILFIAAGDSPTGQPLLVTSNEVSGTVSVFGLAGTGSPAVTIELASTGGIPVVPAEGGRFQFSVVLSNTTEETQTVEAWSAATFPDGSVTQADGSNRLLGPVTVTLAPGQTVSRSLVQTVPGSIPAGGYTYTGLVGDFPDAPVDRDDFPAVKQAARGGGAPVAAWQVLDAATGEPVRAGASWQSAEAPAAASKAPAAFALAAVYPNPFRASTEIALDVPEASQVTLAVFDVLGRRVAVLLDGVVEAGSHRVAFDGSALPSGVYLVRATSEGTAQRSAQTQRVTLVR